MIDFEFPSSLLALVLFTLDPPSPPAPAKQAIPADGVTLPH